jgi:hypothetical protein
LELFLWKSFVSSHNCVQWGYMIIRVCQICEIVYLFSILILISLLYLFMISLCYGWHYKLNCDVAILKKTKRLGLMHENISMNSESDTFHMIWIQTNDTLVLLSVQMYHIFMLTNFFFWYTLFTTYFNVYTHSDYINYIVLCFVFWHPGEIHNFPEIKW